MSFSNKFQELKNLKELKILEIGENLEFRDIQ